MKYRFIAGAICPSCQAVDRIMAYKNNRKCVACGFQDKRPNETGAPPLPDNLGVPVQTLRLPATNDADDDKGREGS